MNRSTDSETESNKEDRIALFLCKCGSNIAATVDIDSLRDRYKERGIHIVDVDDHLCSEQGVYDLIGKIKESESKRVVIAGCSPNLHNDLFSDALKEAGIDPGHLYMANIREQCSWIHYNDKVRATKKAETIIDTGIEWVRNSQPIPTREMPIVQRAMVIGGGVAGLTAALELADEGIETIIVEKEGFLGGHMAKWDKLFPTFDCSICILGPKMTRAARHENIRIMTLSDIVDVKGNVGHYRVTLSHKARFVDIDTCTGCNKCIEVCPVEVVDNQNYGLGKRKAMIRPLSDSVPIAPYIDMENCVGCQSCAGVCEPKSLRFDDTERIEEVDVGAIIVATGFSPYDASIVEELGYGYNDDVITSVELERLLNPNGPSGGKLVRPSDGKQPRRVVIAACVGSRSSRLNRPYCSRACCSAAIKEAIQIKQQLPDSEAYYFYTDIRTYGKGQEELYVRAGEEYDIRFVRGLIGEVERDPATHQTIVRAEDTLLNRPMELKADLVVLMVGMDHHPSNKKLSKMLRIPLDENGFFMEQHPKLSPSSTSSKGVFIAGTAQGPKNISESVAHAGLAASKVKTLLRAGNVETEACIPSFDADLCMGCRICEEACASKAIAFGNNTYPEIDWVACRACGACVASCPSGALDLPCFTNQQLINATATAVRFNTSRPALVGYLCRWCAYTAADRAGTSRIQYPPNMIPIQVPCTGRLTSDALLSAFAEGADGVAVMGCHIQDCHYRSGARYAKDRTDKIKEVLEAAGIDKSRLYFGSVSAAEADSYANQVNDFVNRIIRLGPLGKELLIEPSKLEPDAEKVSGG